MERDPGQDPWEIEMTVLPRYAIELPYVLPAREGIDPASPESWPRVPGRIEYLAGRLLYMPPCGDEQQSVAVDVTTELNNWRRLHAEFFVGGNEAGMMLGEDVRAADAAVWKLDDVRPFTGRFPRRPPLLAVEVTGRDEGLEALEEKGRWYLEHGVTVVWVLVPSARLARVLTAEGSSDHGLDDRMPPHPALPGLEPRVRDLFRQLLGS